MQETFQYRLGFFEYGDLYSSRVDRKRMTTIDNEILSMAKVVSDGVLSGWDISDGGSLTADISPGRGIAGSKFVATLSEQTVTLTGNAVNRIYAIPRSTLFLNRSAFSSTESITPLDSTAPAAPTGFTVNSFTKSTVSLSWSANTETDFKEYVVFRKLTAAATFTEIARVTTTAFTHTGLSASTSYDFKIKAADKSGNESADSAILTVTTSADIDPPGDITSIIGAAGNASARIQYGASLSASVTKYIITITERTSTGSLVSTTVVDNGLSLFYNATGLTNGNIYDFLVQAENAATLKSDGISIRLAPVTAGAPIPPTGLSTTPFSTSIDLSWTASVSSGVTDYFVTVDTDEISGSRFRVGAITSTTITSFPAFIDGESTTVDIAEDTNYTIFVAAEIDNGTTALVGLGAVTTTTTPNTTPPDDATDLAASPGHTIVNLTWERSPSADVTTYELEIDAGAGFGPPTDLGDVTSFTTTGLTNGTLHTFKIKAKDSASLLSTGITVTATPTADVAAPAIPAAFKISSIHPTQVRLTWNENAESDLGGYTIERSTTTDAVFPDFPIVDDIVGPFVTLGTVTGTTFIDVETEAETTYTYRISAFDVNGNSSATTNEPRLRTPSTDPLDKPEGLSASSVSNTVTLTWDSSLDTFNSWNIYRSTSEFEGFKLINSVDSSILTYVDSNLIADGSIIYYYRIEKVSDTAEIVVETDTSPPEDAVLIGTVTTDLTSITAINNTKRIIANLQAVLVGKTGELIKTHKHSEAPSNNTSLATISAFTLETTDNITYTITSDDIVGNTPDITKFIIKVGGIRPATPFTFIDGGIIFDEALTGTPTVIADGEARIFYAQGQIDSPFAGVYPLLDGERTNLAFALDRQSQLIAFEAALTGAPLVTVSVEPVNPEFFRAAPSQINLNDSGFISDFSTTDFQNYISADGWETTSVAFVFVNGSKTILNYVIDAGNKRIQFTDGPIFGNKSIVDPPFLEEPIITLEVLAIQEVDGDLAADSIAGLDASIFTDGVFDKNLLPSISHEGRIKELATPAGKSTTTADGYLYEIASGLGNATTIFGIGKSDEGVFLVGSSQGLLRSDDDGVTYSIEEISFSTREVFRKIFTDSQGSVYFIGQSTIFRSIDFDSPTSDKIFEMDGLDKVAAIHDIIEDDEENLFIATDLGVYIFKSDDRLENTWVQTSLLGGATTETLSLVLCRGNTILAGTETGLYDSVDSGETWEFVIDLEDDVFNLIRSDSGIMIARAGDSFWRAQDIQYCPTDWTKVSTFRFMTEGTLVTFQGDKVFMGDTTGLYESDDFATTFSLFEGAFNLNPNSNAIKELKNIDGQIFFSTDNNLFRIDTSGVLHIQSQFIGTVIPTILLNGEVIEQGYTYNNASDSFTDAVIFKIKRKESDIVTIINEYVTYFAANGGWYDINPFAAVTVLIDNIPQDSDLFTFDPVDGSIVFITPLEKPDVVRISIKGVTVKNIGQFSHMDIEDTLSKETAQGGYGLSEVNIINSLQLGLGIEHNFLEPDTETVYSGAEIDTVKSFNSELKNSNFHIFGRKSFDNFGSTVDQILQKSQEEVGAHGYIALSTLEVPSGKIWVGTDNGIFVFSADFLTKDFIAIEGVEKIYDLVLVGTTIYVVADNSLYSTEDAGATFTKNRGLGLPAQHFSFIDVSSNLIMGTNEGLFYSINTFRDDTFEIWVAATVKDLEDNDITLKDNTYVLEFGNFTYAAVGKSILTTTNGIVWTKKFEFQQDLTVNEMRFIDQVLYIATTKGLFVDGGTLATDEPSLTLLDLTNNPTTSANVSVNDVAAEDDGTIYAVGDTNIVYSSIDGGLTWQAKTISGISHIEKIIVGSVTLIAGDKVFIQDILGEFVETNTLSNSLGNIGVNKNAQIVKDITTDISHVRLYLEPFITSSSSFNVTLSIFATNVLDDPTGSPLVSSVLSAATINRPDWYNFSIPLASPPSDISLVLSQQGGDANNYVSWSYNPNNDDDGLAKSSDDNGVTWDDLLDKDFTYRIYKSADSVDEDNQLITTVPAIAATLTDDVESDFALGTFDNTKVISTGGGNVVIDFKDLVISFVVDESGSMTWSDNGKSSIDMIEDILNDFEDNYPGTLKYDLISFGGKQIGTMKITAVGVGDFSFDFAGARVLRKLLSDGFSVDESDGTIVAEGLIDSARDSGLSPGIDYAYSVFPFDASGNFGDSHKVSIKAVTPEILFNVADLQVEARVVLSAGDDLGDREVDVTFLNPEGKNYTDVIVVRNEERQPETIDDGSIIFSGLATTSTQTVTDTFDFITGQVYHYGVFTKSLAGVFSSSANARRATIFVPPVVRTWEKDDAISPPAGFDSTPPGDVTGVTTSKSPQTAKLSWVLPVGALGALVLKSEVAPPTFSGDGSLVELTTSAEVVFDGGSSTTFVDRGLENDKAYFYKIVAYDKVRNFADGINASITPKEDDPDLIEPEDIANLSAELVTSTEVLLKWDNPVSSNERLDLFYTNPVSISTTLTYADGASIADNVSMDFDIKSVILEFSDDIKVAPPIGTTATEEEDTGPQSADPTQFTFAQNDTITNNTVTAILNTTDRTGLIDDLKNMEFTVRGVAATTKEATGDPEIQVVSDDLVVRYSHPISIELENVPRQTIKRQLLSADDVGRSSVKTETKPGVYIRSGETFKARAKVLINGAAPVVPVNVSVTVFDIEEESPLTRAFEPSTIITPVSAQFVTANKTITADGVSQTYGIAEIELNASDAPADIVIQATVTFGGFTRTAYFSVFYENILNITLNAGAPLADGTDVVEQSSFAFLGAIDAPDSEKEPLPNDVVIEWSLVEKADPVSTLIADGLLKVIEATDARPFYSTDSVTSQTNGIFSKLKNGVAKKVFFGPVKNILLAPAGTDIPAESYEISAKVTYDGLTRVVTKPVDIIPIIQIAPETGLVSLMSDGTTFSSIDTIWADGQDTATMTVLADPSASSLTRVTDIYALFDPKIELVEGDVITIEAAGIDILTDFGKKTGRNSATITDGKATILLQIGTFVGPSPNGDEFGDTTLIDLIDGTKAQIPSSAYPPFSAVFASITKTLDDGTSATFYGGGANGNPPNSVVFREPLKISQIFATRADQAVTNIIPDGQTITEVIVPVSFRGEDVPNGTEVTMKIGSGPVDAAGQVKTLIPVDGFEFIKSTVKTKIETYTDQRGSSVTGSIARAQIRPVSSSSVQEIVVQANCGYDELGTIKRAMSFATTLAIANTAGHYLNAVEEYDPSTDAWAEKASMNVSRLGLSTVVVGSKIYAIGGINQDYLQTTEEFDPSLNTWTKKALMNNPRAYASAVVYSGKIYVFGGINKDGGDVETTASVEVYDPFTNTWTEKTDMPTGLAFATTQAIGSKVYVLFGASSVSIEGISTNNFDVFEYDIVGDSWATHDTLASARIAPTSVLDGGDIVVLGGVTEEITTEFGTANDKGRVKTSVQLEYEDEIFVYDPVAKTGSTPASAPLARSRAGTSVISSDGYIIGGSADKSNTLNSVEKFDIGTLSFAAGPFTKMPTSRYGLGVASFGGKVYAIGGGGSGHDTGWLRLDSRATPDELLADGRHNSSIVVRALDDSGDAPDKDVQVTVKGFIYLPLAIEEEDPDSPATTSSIFGITSSFIPGSGAVSTVTDTNNQTLDVYPILFSASSLTLKSGVTSNVLLPRSEDVLLELAELEETVNIEIDIPKIGEEDDIFGAESFARTTVDGPLIMKQGQSRDLYRVVVEITVKDDFFFGQTDTISTINKNTVEPTSTDARFIFDDGITPQELSPDVGFFSDIMWTPTISKRIDEITEDATEIQTAITAIRDAVPFGGSPLLDGLFESADRLADKDLDPSNKIIIAVTDFEENTSSNDIDTIIANINQIDSDDVPAFISNFLVTDPVALAAREVRTDTINLEKISADTGGRSYSILDASYLPIVIDRIKEDSVTGILRGSYINTHDFGEEVNINSIRVNATIPTNSDVKIRAQGSDDGFVFGEFTEFFDANQDNSLNPFSFRYLKYELVLTATSFATPTVTSVAISYADPTEQFIFSDVFDLTSPIKEIAMVANGTVPTGSSIELGVSHSDSTNFDRDFQSVSVPALNNYGISIRLNREHINNISLDSATINPNETLNSIDNKIYSTDYGKWVFNENVNVFRNGSPISSSEFTAVPAEGKVILHKRQASSDDLRIGLDKETEFRIGIKIKNKSDSEAVVIDEFAYTYNTGEAVSNVVIPGPVASSVIVDPIIPFINSTLTAKYTYTDEQNRPETGTAIRWYRNGVLIPLLNDKTSFSAVNVPESKLSRGDRWFFTVRPKNGFTFGTLESSPTAIISNTPPTVSNIQIKGVLGGVATSKIFSNSTVRLSYDFGDEDLDVESGTVISWFVNGILLKKTSEAIKSISSTETLPDGSPVLAVGNTISVTIIPSDGINIGEAFSSGAAIVSNTPPAVTDAELRPLTPTESSGLEFTYTFVDPDTSQTDESTIKWFRDDEEVTDLEGVTFVPPGSLVRGEKWFVEITPFDGVDSGTKIKSNTIFVTE